MPRPLLAAVLLGWACTGAALASPEVDQVNGGLGPPFLVWGTDRAGWIWVPTRNLLLDGIFSTFRNVGAASQSGPILRRDVTVSLHEGSRSGPLLARGVFSADASAGNLGAVFTPALVLAGRPYFISYSGLTNLGLNIVDWNISAPLPQQPAGTVNLDGWYSGERFEVYTPRVVNGVLQVFSAPILRFQGLPAAAFSGSAADCLFNWAERRFPTLLAPAGGASATFQHYYYRHYAATRSYVGVSGADGRVYYLGPDGVLVDVGALAGWLAEAGC